MILLHHLDILALGAAGRCSIAFTPYSAAFAAPELTPSAVQRVSGGLPHRLPMFAQLTHLPELSR